MSIGLDLNGIDHKTGVAFLSAQYSTPTMCRALHWKTGAYKNATQEPYIFMSSF